jgi:transposase
VPSAIGSAPKIAAKVVIMMGRNRSIVATHHKVTSRTICDVLGVGKEFVRKCCNKFDTGGADALFARQSRSNRKVDDEKLVSAVFSLLHQPPADHGINRTTWTMSLLSQVLKENDTQIGPALVSKIIKAAGYKLRKAKVVLASNDPAPTLIVSRPIQRSW